MQTPPQELPAAAFLCFFSQNYFADSAHFSTLAVDRKKAVVLKSWHKSNDRGKVFRKAGFREQGMGESLVPSDGRKNTPGAAT